MAEHCDHIHSIFEGERKGIPVMTALGSLNDDYMGGEFLYDVKGYYKRLKQGEMFDYWLERVHSR